MASRVPCTCGCGLEVSYTTKQNHLNAHGKISLRVRVMTEMGSLNRNTQQQQKPTSLLQRRFRKRASSNPDQDGSRKQRKAAQLKGNQLPEITTSSQVDTDLMEDLPPPMVANTDRQSRFIERSRGVMKMRWMTRRRDGSSLSDGKGSDSDGGEDGRDKDEDGDRDDEDGEDGDEDDKDEDEPSNISDWDLLGKDFEREAAAPGLYSLYELPTQLTTL